MCASEDKRLAHRTSTFDRSWLITLDQNCMILSLTTSRRCYSSNHDHKFSWQMFCEDFQCLFIRTLYLSFAYMKITSTKDSSLFIPIELEYILFSMQRSLFVVSCVLHVPALVCLHAKTPPHQAQIKLILICVQVSTFIFCSLLK